MCSGKSQTAPKSKRLHCLLIGKAHRFQPPAHSQVQPQPWAHDACLGSCPSSKRSSNEKGLSLQREFCSACASNKFHVFLHSLAWQYTLPLIGACCLGRKMWKTATWSHLQPLAATHLRCFRAATCGHSSRWVWLQMAVTG